jgi:hypothetical protein
MDEFDDELKTALRSGQRVEISADEIGTVRGLLTEIFRFRSKLIAVGSVLKIAAFLVAAIGGFVWAFVADSERGRFLAAFVSLFAAVSVGVGWQFHWALLNRNALLRELKRLEVAIGAARRE